MNAATASPQPAAAGLSETGLSEAEAARRLAQYGANELPRGKRRDALVEESRQYGQDWAIVFVASLSGRDGRAPTSKEAEQSLQRMIESVKTGMFGSFIPFDRQGEPVLLS